MSWLRELLLRLLLRKEVFCMAVVYATLIVKGKKTLDQVPALIRNQSRRSSLTLRLLSRAEQQQRAALFKQGGPKSIY